MGKILPVIRRGDSTSHGGVVIEGFSDGPWGVFGTPAAGLGHAVTCPLHRGLQRIAEGDSSKKVHGVPIALEGMKTTCGATLIASQHTMCVERVGTATLPEIGVFMQSGLVEGNDPWYDDSHLYDQQFHLIDEANGEPVANRAYRIKVNGRIYEGKTDANGKTQRISADGPYSATIEVFAEGV